MSMIIKTTFFLYFSIIYCVGQQLFTSYDYFNNGVDWANCGSLNLQESPINLNYTNAKIYSSVRYLFANYNNTEAQVTFYNVSVNVSTQSFGQLYAMTSDSTNNICSAQSVLFRSPAEHIIGDQQYLLEMQIYHKVIIYLVIFNWLIELDFIYQP